MCVHDCICVCNIRVQEWMGFQRNGTHKHKHSHTLSTDGHLTYERYLILKNDIRPTRTQTVCVYLFIFFCLSLPFLMPCYFWVSNAPATVLGLSRKGERVQKILMMGAFFQYGMYVCVFVCLMSSVCECICLCSHA